MNPALLSLQKYPLYLKKSCWGRARDLPKILSPLCDHVCLWAIYPSSFVMCTVAMTLRLIKHVVPPKGRFADAAQLVIRGNVARGAQAQSSCFIQLAMLYGTTRRPGMLVQDHLLAKRLVSPDHGFIIGILIAPQGRGKSRSSINHSNALTVVGGSPEEVTLSAMRKGTMVDGSDVMSAAPPSHGETT